MRKSPASIPSETGSADSLFGKATAALAKSYAPYSGFSVGAAVEDGAGRVFEGANVENASYGLTVCAERVAIFNAVSAGARKIRALAIVSNKRNPCMPCGACLQVLAEFADDALIYLTDADGLPQPPVHLNYLLPARFDGAILLKKK